jgi:hypothetical protein
MTRRYRVVLTPRACGDLTLIRTVYYHVIDETMEVVHVRDDRRKPLAPGML